MSEQLPDSFLSPDGTKLDGSIVTRIRQEEADVVFQTQEQKSWAIKLIKSGEVTTIDEASAVIQKQIEEVNASFQTQGQKDRAIELIKEGKAKDADDAYQVMRKQDEGPLNDAHSPRE